MKKYKNTILKGDGNLIAKQINFELKRILQREKREKKELVEKMLNIPQEFKDECEKNSHQIMQLIYESAKKLWDIRLKKIDNLCENVLSELQSKRKRKITKRRLKRKKIFLIYSQNGNFCWIEQKGERITDIIQL